MPHKKLEGALVELYKKILIAVDLSQDSALILEGKEPCQAI